MITETTDNPIQQDMFPGIILPRKYLTPITDVTDMSWPVEEVLKDLNTIDKMLSLMKEVDSLARGVSICNYFIFKYGDERGFTVFILCKQLINYIELHKEELEKLGFYVSESSTCYLDIPEHFINDLLLKFV